MTTFFEDLGKRVETAWHRAHFSEAAFPDVCMEALCATPPSAHVDIDDVIALGFRKERLPRQIDPDSVFGQPPITTFDNSRFSISVLFWFDATTAIHEHSFSGAFHVLRGESLHTSFRFTELEAVNEYLRIGKLETLGVELLERGAVREIRSGGGTIHSLFHLEHPSVSVVVRTHRASISRPPYAYWRPGIACDETYDRSELKRRRDLMDLVRKTRPDRLTAYCEDWLASTDFVSGFLGLRHCLELLPPEDGDVFLQRVRERHPRLADLAQAVVENARREAFITRRRTTVKDRDLRFFLALLLNVRGREEILRVLSARAPLSDAVEQIVEWVHALAQLPAPGVDDRSALGFEVDDVVLGVLRSLLRGRSRPEVAFDVASLAKRQLSPDETADVIELCDALEGSEVFRYLLQSGADRE